MLLICPGCGLTASPEAWVNDAAVRETVAGIVRLPKPVQDQAFPYLGLFRPEKRALSWARARRLVAELASLVSAGTVQGLAKGPPRPCIPALWAEGMRQMAERKGGQRASMTNHNYLRAIVYDLADQADAGREREERRAEAKHARPAPREPEPEPDDIGGEQTPETSANRRAFFEALERLGKKTNIPEGK